MVHASKFKVLNDVEKLLKITNLYNKNGSVCIGKVKVPNIFVNFVVFLPMTYSIVMFIWLCYDENFDLNKVSPSISLLLGTVQMQLMIVLLTIKKRAVVETMEELQHTIDESEFSSSEKYAKRGYKEKLSFKIGCEYSPESCEIYTRCNQLSSRLVEIFIKIAAACSIGLFGVPALVPICYTIFNYPTPDQWPITIPAK